MRLETFWMVLADNSPATHVRHANFSKAQSEAKRLASLNPGTRFWVLQSMGAAQRSEPVAWLECDDEIPF